MYKQPEALPFDWKNEGFNYPPKRIILKTPLTVYRVWGGQSNEMGSPHSNGVFFSTRAPGSQFEAQRLFNVWIHGNNTSRLTKFTINAGTEIFAGHVDWNCTYIDPLLMGNESAIQILVMNPINSKIKKVRELEMKLDFYKIIHSAKSNLKH